MNKKHIDSLAASVSNDVKVRLSIEKLASKYDEWTKEFLVHCYTSPKIASIWAELRNKSSIEDHLRGSKDRRAVIKYPNRIVERFVEDQLNPKYGYEWWKDTSKLAKIARNEDLLKPWVIAKI